MSKKDALLYTIKISNIGQHRTLSVVEPDSIVANMPRYKVLLHNDDKNDMIHVMLTLMHIFHFLNDKAGQIMLEAHKTGVALCVIEPLEIAELRRDQLIACSLVSTIEKE